MKRTPTSRTIILVAVVLTGCMNEYDPPDVPATLGRRLMVGEHVGCALDTAATVYCWGRNSSFYEYGTSVAINPGGSVPTESGVRELSAFGRGAGSHYCGLTNSGSIVCWGRNESGQLGSGIVGTGGGEPPVTVTGGIHWTSLSVGRLITCGLSDAGAAYCWGLNQHGEIGSSTVGIATRMATPTAVEGGHVFKAIAAGWLHACGITTGGATYCWGANNSGQLGVGTVDTVNYLAPTLVTGGQTFTQISLGSRYSCGLTADGTVYCWGENATGQLGDGTQTVRSVPTLVAGGLKFSQIATSSGFQDGTNVPAPVSLQGGVSHTCAITTGGQPYCWGWNGSGELGDGTTVDKATPTLVSGGLTISTIGTGGAYSCGMQDNYVWCWGSNFNGQLGIGGFVNAPTPQAVLPPFRP